MVLDKLIKVFQFVIGHELGEISILIETALEHFITTEVYHVVREEGTVVGQDTLEEIISLVKRGIQDTGGRTSVDSIGTWDIIGPILFEAKDRLSEFISETDCAGVPWVIELWNDSKPELFSISYN